MSFFQIIKQYLNRNWSPLRLKYGAKQPPGKWENNTITAENLETLLPTNQQWNVGVLLGKASDGLVDVDLDVNEAAQVADLVWPPGPTFGRKSRPRSHRLIRCPDAKGRLPFESTLR